MAEPHPATPVFENQPDVVAELSGSELPELSPVPRPGEYIADEEQRRNATTGENYITDNISDEIADLRDAQFKIAENYHDLRQNGNGSYTTHGIRRTMPDKTVIVLKGEDAYNYQMERFAVKREALVQKLKSHIERGNGANVTLRLWEEAAAGQRPDVVQSLEDAAARGEGNLAGSSQAYVAAMQAMREAGRQGIPLATSEQASKSHPASSRQQIKIRRHWDGTEKDRTPVIAMDEGQRESETAVSQALAAGALVRDAALASHARHLRAGEHAASRHDLKWTAGHSEGGIEFLESYNSFLSGIIEDANRERGEKLHTANLTIGQAAQRLESQPLADAHYDPGVEGEIEELLQTAGENIDGLSVKDERRGQLLTLLNKTRFRMLQRHITANIADGLDYSEYVAYYGDDGGIYINTTEGPRVIYEDGSASRQEGGSFVRRWGDGQEWTTPPEPRIEAAFYDRVESIESRDELKSLRDEAFVDWERLRRPDDKLRAAGYIEEYAVRLDHEAVTLYEQQSAMEAELQDLQALDEPNDEQRRRTTELMGNIRTAASDRQALHAEINRNRYWQGILSAESVPPAGPARIGRIAMSGAVEPTPPHVLANGTLVWNILGEDNRLQSWEINPNGTATLRATS